MVAHSTPRLSPKPAAWEELTGASASRSADMGGDARTDPDHTSQLAGVDGSELDDVAGTGRVQHLAVTPVDGNMRNIAGIGRVEPPEQQVTRLSLGKWHPRTAHELLVGDSRHLYPR